MARGYIIYKGEGDTLAISKQNSRIGYRRPREFTSSPFPYLEFISDKGLNSEASRNIDFTTVTSSKKAA